MLSRAVAANLREQRSSVDACAATLSASSAVTSRVMLALALAADAFSALLAAHALPQHSRDVNGTSTRGRLLASVPTHTS